MAPPSLTTSTPSTSSHEHGPLAVVRRLRYVPELADGVVTLATFGAFYICLPTGQRPALAGPDAGCVITPTDSSPPTRMPDLPIRGRFTVVAASSSSSGGGNPYRAQQIHVIQASWHRPDPPAHPLFIRSPMAPQLLG